MNDKVISTWIEKMKEKIDLPSFNDGIDKLLRRILSENCRFIIWENSEYSKHQYNKGSNSFNICIKEICDDQREMIWDIFHEFGHCLDTWRITNEEKKEVLKVQRREVTAWIYADIEFNKIDEFQKEIEHYEKYRWKCLNTYGIQWVDLKQTGL